MFDWKQWVVSGQIFEELKIMPNTQKKKKKDTPTKKVLSPKMDLEEFFPPHFSSFSSSSSFFLFITKYRSSCVLLVLKIVQVFYIYKDNFIVKFKPYWLLLKTWQVAGE